LRRSALVSKSRRPRQLSGALCPNPRLPDGQRLDDVLGSGFALVATSRPPDRPSGVVVVIAQPGSELEDWLHRGRATAAIVRPDRTVMRAGRDAAALCRWTATVVRGRRTADLSGQS
jgi:3-(3-hydroxy-phenyl)propionate hydroxylase